MGQVGETLRYKPSGRTMALGSTREMRPRKISLGGKSGPCVGLTNLQLSFTEFLAVLEPKVLKPSGPVQTYTGIALLYQECTNPGLQITGNTTYGGITHVRVLILKFDL
jgi:hypothetical protein